MGKRYVSYIRVSTEKQGRSGLGLEAQRAAVEGYVRAQGGSVLHEYVEIESGTKSDRPELAKALAHARLTGAVLVVAKLDRLARNVHFLSSIMESKVDFVAVDNPNANRLTIHILAAIAEYEREMISRRTRDALLAARARGVRLGNPNGAKALSGLGNGPAVEALRAAARERAENVLPVIEAIRTEGVTSLRAIAAELNRRGIRTPHDKAWHPASVSRVLGRAAQP